MVRDRSLATEDFSVLRSSISALRPTEPPIQRIPGALSQGVKGKRCELTSPFQLMPRTRKRGSLHPLPQISSWHNAQLPLLTMTVPEIHDSMENMTSLEGITPQDNYINLISMLLTSQKMF
jgi:hypothetical protein